MFRAFCRLCFHLRGWGFIGQLPSFQQYIVLVGPHTSSWDFIYGVAARDVLKTDIKFIGKRELFKFPFKNFFFKLGGYPVSRKKNEKSVDMIAGLFVKNESFILALSPEGTRSKVTELRSGFYHVARQAGVPYVLVGMDYKLRRFIIGEPVFPGPEVVDELGTVYQFFVGITGKNPELGIGS